MPSPMLKLGGRPVYGFNFGGRGPHSQYVVRSSNLWTNVSHFGIDHEKLSSSPRECILDLGKVFLCEGFSRKGFPQNVGENIILVAKSWFSHSQVGHSQHTT